MEDEMLIERIQALVARVTEGLGWLPPAVARLALGLTFIGTGWGKLHSLDKLIDYFTELGIPAASIQAPMVAGIELVGGVLILVGLFTRLAALPLMGTMIVAILTAQRESIHGLGDLVGLIEFAYFTLFLWLAVAGPGKLSLDHVLARVLAKRRAASPLPSPRASS